MKKRTAARSMAALMGAAMVLTACGGGNTTAPTTGASSGGETQTASESAESGKITKTDILVGQASDIVTLDPAGQQDTTSGVLMKHAYSTLLDVDNEGKVVPDLAESYEMKSDTEYVFKLREDACFWDGTPVTAQDVKFSLDRAKGMPKTKSNTSKIEEVTVNGDHEVTIKLTEPYAAFKTIVTQHNLSILSEKAVTEAGDSYGDVDNLLGSGPFKVTEWVPNDHYTLVRNDNYWGEMPIATSITCRVIPEGSARTIALEAGEIDVVWSVDPTDCANVESNPDVKLLSQPSTGIDYVGMNTQKEKFSDKRVRQAINYALDKQAFVDTIIEGRGLVANSYINAAIPGWTDEVEAYPYDPEKAKELLAEAGYPDGFSCVILTDSRTYHQALVELLQATLSQVGITLEVQTMELAKQKEVMATGEGFDLFLLDNVGSAGDPLSSLWRDSNPEFSGAGGTNYLFYTMDKEGAAEYAEILHKIRACYDDSERMELCKEMQQIFAENLIWIPVNSIQAYVLATESLQGVTFGQDILRITNETYFE